MQEMVRGKVPGYMRKSIKDYQHRNRRVQLFIDRGLYSKFIEGYGGMSFNSYVKALMDRALEAGGRFGQLPYSGAPGDCVRKHCVFSKDYERRVLERYAECMGRQAPIRKGRGQGKGFSFVAYLQWLVAEDLGGLGG